MKGFQKTFHLATFVLVVLICVVKIRAQDIQIKAEEPMIFRNGDATENNTIEPSTVEPIGNGKYLLVADDETEKATNTNLAVVEASSGKVIIRLQISCVGVNPGTCFSKNPKWEAMAKDEDGYFYIIGSHAVKPDETDTGQKLTEKFLSRSHLYRFRLIDESVDGTEIKIDEKSVIEINVREFFKKAGFHKPESPTNSPLKIEGLAVRKNGNIKELIIGLRERETSDSVLWVYSGEFPNAPKNGEILSLKPFFNFDAGKIKNTRFKLSSIEYVPSWRGFLVLTSTEDNATNAFFGNRLWFISDETVEISQPSNSSQALKPLDVKNIWQFAPAETEDKKAMKAEGISVLGECSLDLNKKIVRVAIVFDNDTQKTKIPGMMQFVELSKTTKR